MLQISNEMEEAVIIQNAGWVKRMVRIIIPIQNTIYSAMPTGIESTLKLRLGDYLLTGVIFGNTAYKIGEEVKINLNGHDILLFDRQSGERISVGHLVIEKNS